MCFHAKLQDLVSERVLSEYVTHSIPLPLSRDEREIYTQQYGVFARAYSAFMGARPGSSWKDFQAAARQTESGRSALAAWQRSRRVAAFTIAKRQAVTDLLRQHWHTKKLVFTSDNAVAYELAMTHLLMPFTCDIGRVEREQALDRFRSGELHTLVSSRVLNEGLDVPDAEVGIIVSGSLGEREHTQRVGRLLRARPGKRALIYRMISVGTSEERALLTEGRSTAVAA